MRAALWTCGWVVVLSAAAFAQAKPEAWRKGDVAPTGKFAVGLEYDSVFARELDETGLSGVETDDTGAVTGVLDPTTETEDVELSSSFIYVRGAYSIYAPKGQPFAIEAYAVLGLMSADLDGDVRQAGEPTQSFEVEGDNAFAYGLGVRARVYSTGNVRFLADLSWRASRHESEIDEVSNLDLDLDPGPPPESSEQDFDMDVTAWQLSVYVSYRLEAGTTTIAPYGGFRLSWVDVDVDGRQNVFDPGFDRSQSIDYSAEQANIFGIFLGAEADFTENVGAFLELRLVDELALTVGAGWRF